MDGFEHRQAGALLAWTLYQLATHPKEMDRLHAEIVERVGRDGDPTYEDLESMAILNAVVLESLRMYPSAGFTRMPVRDVELGGYRVPRYTEILILPYIFHRDPANWERPDEFVPERMMNEGYETRRTSSSGGSAAKEEEGEVGEEFTSSSLSSTSRANSLQTRIARIGQKKAFLPFSLGPRNCVGRPLALLEVRVVLIKLIQKFDFVAVNDDPEFDPVPVLTLTLNPASIKLVPKLRHF